MATIGVVTTEEAGHTHRFLWEEMTGTDDGEAISFPGVPDCTVQVMGTFNSTTIIFEGSLQTTPTTWFQLTDDQGADVSFTAAGGKRISQLVAHIRPRITADGGSGDLDVFLFCGH